MTKTKQFSETLWETFSHHLQEKRRKKMEDVANKRTPYIRLVLQDLHDPHNISACLRSASISSPCFVYLMILFRAFNSLESSLSGPILLVFI